MKMIYIKEQLEDKFIIYRIISSHPYEDTKSCFNFYKNILLLTLHEFYEINDEQIFKEIITPILDFINYSYSNRACNSLRKCISNSIILISLQVIYSFIFNDIKKQQKLLELNFISIIFPLMIIHQIK
jgi:hypothetical protein